MNGTKIRVTVAATLALGVLGSAAAIAPAAFASGGGGVQSSGA